MEFHNRRTVGIHGEPVEIHKKAVGTHKKSLHNIKSLRQYDDLFFLACVEHLKIILLQKDPKQQELRILQRTL